MRVSPAGECMPGVQPSQLHAAKAQKDSASAPGSGRRRWRSVARRVRWRTWQGCPNEQAPQEMLQDCFPFVRKACTVMGVGSSGRFLSCRS